MQIIIVGAGLGGLGTALALRTATISHEVLVLESAEQLAEVSSLNGREDCEVKY